MLLLYLLGDDWPISMISGSNEQLQQQLEYTQLKPDSHSWWISEMQSDILEERYAIKFCFKLGKNVTETYEMLQTAFGASWTNRASVFEGHKRFKEGRESVRDDERCGRCKEVNTPELIGQRVRVRVEVLSEYRKKFRRKRPALFKSGQWHIHKDNMPVHISILFTDYLIKMGINTVPDPPYRQDLSPCDFWLFIKLRGCRYETIEEMKEAVTNVTAWWGENESLHHGVSPKSGRPEFWKNKSDHKKKYKTQEKVCRGRENEVHVDETRNWRTNHKISTPSTKCESILQVWKTWTRMDDRRGFNS